MKDPKNKKPQTIKKLLSAKEIQQKEIDMAERELEIYEHDSKLKEKELELAERELEIYKKDSDLRSKELQLQYLFDTGIDFEKRTILLTSDIDYPLFDFIDGALSEMETRSKKAITVKINSFGGSVYEALAIVGRMTKSNCQIITEGYGAIMSAATLILGCADIRKISKWSWYMWHEAHYGTDERTRHSDHKAQVQQAEREEIQWANAMAQYSNKDSEFWRNTGVGIDAFYTPEELLEMGVVDEIF